MNNPRLMIGIVGVLATMLGTAAQADLIVNGGFEDQTPPFDSWIGSAMSTAQAETSSVISGAVSAEIASKTTLIQDFTGNETPSFFKFGCDFAYFDAGTSNNVQTILSPYANSALLINMVINPSGNLTIFGDGDGNPDNGNTGFAYWDTGLDAIPSTDTGVIGDFDGETVANGNLVVNHLEVTVHGLSLRGTSGKYDPLYDVTLNGNTASNLTYFHHAYNGVGDYSTMSFGRLRLAEATHTNARTLFDNVSVVSIPEPSTIILLLLGAAGLFANARRRRR